MTFNALAKKFSTENGISGRASVKAVKSLMEIIREDVLTHGARVNLPGFGVFYPRTRRHEGGTMQTSVRFRPSIHSKKVTQA